MLWILAILVSATGTIFSAVGVVTSSAIGARYLPTSLLALLAAVVALVLALVMLAGRPWARVSLTTLGAVAIAGSIASAITVLLSFTVGGSVDYASGGLALALLIPLARAVLVVAAIVVSFLPSANRWFAATAAR